MKLLKKITCALLTVVVLNSSFVMPVLAAEESPIVELEAEVIPLFNSASNAGIELRSTTFIDTSISIAYNAEGMHVSIYTDLNGVGSVVGAKDIKVQKKGLFGSWTTVATVEGGEVTNASGCIIRFIYLEPELGETYRVTCTHYGNVDEYRELYHETEGFTCVY